MVRRSGRATPGDRARILEDCARAVPKWLYMDSSRIGRDDSDGTHERCDCGCTSGLWFRG